MVSIAVLVLVLGLYEELDKSRVKKEHTPELTEVMVQRAIEVHASELRDSAGITSGNMIKPINGLLPARR